MCKPHRAAKTTILNNYNKEQVQQKVLLEIEEKLLKKKKTTLCFHKSRRFTWGKEYTVVMQNPADGTNELYSK